MTEQENNTISKNLETNLGYTEILHLLRNCPKVSRVHKKHIVIETPTTWYDRRKKTISIGYTIEGNNLILRRKSGQKYNIDMNSKDYCEDLFHGTLKLFGIETEDVYSYKGHEVRRI